MEYIETLREGVYNAKHTVEFIRKEYHKTLSCYSKEEMIEDIAKLLEYIDILESQMMESKKAAQAVRPPDMGKD